MKKQSIIKLVTITSFIALAITWRLINHQLKLAPNLEIITALSVITALLFGLRYSLIVALGSMVASDVLIGNSSIFIFTWSAFAIIGASAYLLSKTKRRIAASVGFAAASSFFFFAVTNFGVWLQGWYPMTWQGLATCFTLAIPFYRTMLIGNLILVPMAVIAYQLATNYQKNKSLVIDSFKR